MAREGKKLELYEILAAKRAKGKMPLGLEGKSIKQANSPDDESDGHEYDPSETAHAPGIIVDDAVRAEYMPPKPPPSQASASHSAPPPRENQFRHRERETAPEPAPEPRPRTPREVVFALDTAFIFFTIVLALIGSSYFLGYKRGQEERPAGLAGIGDIETLDPARIGMRNLSPAPRTTVRPPEDYYTLILRTEPASEELPERLELELSEAVAKGSREAKREIQGFIFRTSGNDPLYVLAVGLGRTANDEGLNDLYKIYYNMDGITMSRTSLPYRSSRIGLVRELGTPVY